MALGAWVGRQRRNFRSGALEPARARQLKAMPGWVWQVADAGPSARWEAAFSQLQRYVAEHGHARPPQVEVGKPGRYLGQWVAAQRLRYARGHLSPRERGRLESLAGWVWGVDYDESWEEGLRCLEAYVAREGSARVPQRHVENGRPLGVWVNNQRMRYHGGRLAPDRAKRLQDVPGWEWKPKASGWEDKFAAFRDFASREAGKAESAGLPRELAAWAVQQRHRYRAGTLSPARIRRLEELPGWDWNAGRRRTGNDGSSG